MKVLLSVFPVALLVAYSQIMVKWRASALPIDQATQNSFVAKLWLYLGDPLIVSAYAAGLIASVIWLFVIIRLPLVVAFPVYIGTTFILVIAGGVLFLHEDLSTGRILAAVLILAGIALGTRAT